jgi:hypothetical protein
VIAEEPPIGLGYVLVLVIAKEPLIDQIGVRTGACDRKRTDHRQHGARNGRS